MTNEHMNHYHRGTLNTAINHTLCFQCIYVRLRRLLRQILFVEKQILMNISFKMGYNNVIANNSATF